MYVGDALTWASKVRLNITDKSVILGKGKVLLKILGKTDIRNLPDLVLVTVFLERHLISY